MEGLSGGSKQPVEKGLKATAEWLCLGAKIRIMR